MPENISLTPEQLKDLVTSAVSTAIAETKKPTAKEQKQEAQEAALLAIQQGRRAQLGKTVRKREANEKARKRNCSHEHKNGDTHCVFNTQEVSTETGKFNFEYIFCQKCQVSVMPGPEPANYNGPNIYDTALFNKLAGKCLQSSGSEMFSD